MGGLPNGKDEQRYIEGQVLIEKGAEIGNVYDVPEKIAFLGHLNTKLPEKNGKGQLENFREQGQRTDGNKKIWTHWV
jgi:hypothetical protein